jgi:hypothetical protein
VLKKNKTVFIIAVACAIILIVIAVVFIIRGCSTDTSNIAHEHIDSGVKWDGEKNYAPKSNVLYGYIPGFTDLSFGANETHQHVNFYNPEQNTVIANISLKLDNGDTIWSASGVKPGYGFYEIDLTKPLHKGEYSAQLVYDFYSDNGSRYNGGIIPFTLHVT